MIKNMGDYAEVNEAYAKFFDSDPPVRTCVAVLELPKKCKKINC